jgi:hypothetical protein
MERMETLTLDLATPPCDSTLQAREIFSPPHSSITEAFAAQVAIADPDLVMQPENRTSDRADESAAQTSDTSLAIPNPSPPYFTTQLGLEHITGSSFENNSLEGPQISHTDEFPNNHNWDFNLPIPSTLDDESLKCDSCAYGRSSKIRHPALTDALPLSYCPMLVYAPFHQSMTAGFFPALVASPMPYLVASGQEALYRHHLMVQSRY